LILVILQFLFFPRLSSAEFNATSKTYVSFFQDARDNEYAPLYEYVEIEGRDPERGRWDFYLSAWGGRDFSTAQFEDANRGELTYAYLRYSPYKDKRFLVSAGRHYIFEGVASEQIDGVSTRWEITPRSGVSLFGGTPVETEFDKRAGDSAYGGRIYHRIPYLAEFGLSAFSEANDRARFRDEAGVDLWLLPHRKIEIKGRSFYNNITAGWGEHAYVLRAIPVKELLVSGVYSRSSYEDVFSARTLDVFSPDFLGVNETLTKTGGIVEYRAGDAVTGALDYFNYSYETMGDAGYYGASVSSAFSGISAGASVHRMEGPVERLRYVEVRVYGAVDLESWRVSADAINHHYDLPFNGVDDAYSLNGTVRYRVSDSLVSNLSIDYGKDPDFISNTTVLFNLVYNYEGGS
jgi:hypothetical protein